MFSEMGKYEPCGLFTKGHFILFSITIISIVIALKKTYHKNKEYVYKIIKNLTLFICILEIFKILLTLKSNPLTAVNTYLPLYFCSILIYAGLMSSFGKGLVKRTGDVILSTGCLVGGIIFIIFPTTSLPMYPAFHFFSIHSFLFHGIMIYLALLLNITMYIKLDKSDVKYFSTFIGIMSLVALIINHIFDSNLMFISKNSPGTPISILYNLTNGSILFNIIMILAQMTLPFYIVYFFASKFYKNKTEFFKN